MKPAETRRSARLRAKGRRPIWTEGEDSEDDNEEIPVSEENSPESPPRKRGRVEGLEEEDEDYVESDSGGSDRGGARRSPKTQSKLAAPPSEKVGPSKRKDGNASRRRGRPPKVIHDDDGDDVETEPEEADVPSRYRIPVEIFGMQKYFVLNGYVYRRHRERRFGLRGLYLRCYQDKELKCRARAVGVWFRKRTEQGDRVLFGRLSQSNGEHNHPKPPKGHFWVKPRQKVMLVPPHLRESDSMGEPTPDYSDFIEPSEENLNEDGDREVSSTNQLPTEPSMDKPDEPAERSTSRSRGSTRRGGTRIGRPKKLDNIQASSPSKSSGPRKLKVQLVNEKSRGGTQSQPTRDSLGLPRLPPALTANKVALRSSGVMPASSALLIFQRTRFVRPLSVKPQVSSDCKRVGAASPKLVNLKSIMNCYRYCMSALVRLQEGHYIGRFPQLRRLINARGSYLMEYLATRTDGRLPLIANDERTRFLLNHEMKQFRGLCDFMLLAPHECERLVESYRRWLSAARSRAWWNNSDILEFACRILLRSDEYFEAYESALCTSQQSTQLRLLFRPLLPLPEAKFLRCEKETSRRWEMRQSLENLNARVTSTRSRGGDPDVAVNELLDEFDSTVKSFLKFFKTFTLGDQGTENDDEQAAPVVGQGTSGQGAAEDN